MRNKAVVKISSPASGRLIVPPIQKKKKGDKAFFLLSKGKRKIEINAGRQDRQVLDIDMGRKRRKQVQIIARVCQ